MRHRARFTDLLRGAKDQISASEELRVKNDLSLFSPAKDVTAGRRSRWGSRWSNCFVDGSFLVFCVDLKAKGRMW